MRPRFPASSKACSTPCVTWRNAREILGHPLGVL
jgi:hypothetical protein